MSVGSSEELQRLQRLIQNLDDKHSRGEVPDHVYRKLHEQYGQRIQQMTVNTVQAPPTDVTTVAAPRIIEVQPRDTMPTFQNPPSSQGRHHGENAAIILVAVAMMLAAVIVLVFLSRSH